MVIKGFRYLSKSTNAAVIKYKSIFQSNWKANMKIFNVQSDKLYCVLLICAHFEIDACCWCHKNDFVTSAFFNNTEEI